MPQYRNITHNISNSALYFYFSTHQFRKQTVTGFGENMNLFSIALNIYVNGIYYFVVFFSYIF